MGYDASLVNILSNGDFDDSKLHVMSIDEREIVDQLDFDGSSSANLPITVADLNRDGKLEVIASSFTSVGNIKTKMNFKIWEIDGNDCNYDPAASNYLTRIQWNGLMNGPKHTGLYAQPYSGNLPSGLTIWRDRVVVTDDVHTIYSGYPNPPESGSYLKVSRTEPTVVEFNPGTTLFWNYVGENRFVPGPYNVVFKMRFGEDDPNIMPGRIALI